MEREIYICILYKYRKKENVQIFVCSYICFASRYLYYYTYINFVRYICLLMFVHLFHQQITILYQWILTKMDFQYDITHAFEVALVLGGFEEATDARHVRNVLFLVTKWEATDWVWHKDIFPEPAVWMRHAEFVAGGFSTQNHVLYMFFSGTFGATADLSNKWLPVGRFNSLQPHGRSLTSRLFWDWNTNWCASVSTPVRLNKICSLRCFQPCLACQRIPDAHPTGHTHSICQDETPFDRGVWNRQGSGGPEISEGDCEILLAAVWLILMGFGGPDGIWFLFVSQKHPWWLSLFGPIWYLFWGIQT